MNDTDQPPFDPITRVGASDDLDGLLRAFFRGVMPHPWPACPAPPARTFALSLRERQSRSTRTLSRFALAASIGLLAGGLWAVSGKLPGDLDSPRAVSVDEGAAERLQPFDPDSVRIKESLIQGREGTGLLLEDFDR